MHEHQGAQEAELADGEIRIVDRRHTFLAYDAHANMTINEFRCLFWCPPMPTPDGGKAQGGPTVAPPTREGIGRDKKTAQAPGKELEPKGANVLHIHSHYPATPGNVTYNTWILQNAMTAMQGVLVYRPAHRTYIHASCHGPGGGYPPRGPSLSKY